MQTAFCFESLWNLYNNYSVLPEHMRHISAMDVDFWKEMCSLNLHSSDFGAFKCLTRLNI